MSEAGIESAQTHCTPKITGKSRAAATGNNAINSTSNAANPITARKQPASDDIPAEAADDWKPRWRERIRCGKKTELAFPQASTTPIPASPIANAGTTKLHAFETEAASKINTNISTIPIAA